MFEDLLEMQERGARDRSLGRSLADNPMSKPDVLPITDLQEWFSMFDAWRFGWAIEDAMAGHIDMPRDGHAAPWDGHAVSGDGRAARRA
ncbi:CrpP-related protein [Rhizobium bangladeshense]|uniref:CrpP-related protein n=1 Tax=Rhizobium bangladeshense TaxID=1138189 RepID=UPI0009ED00CB|nr:CrpP-related protein [Rhizobium bangladeshense]